MQATSTGVGADPDHLVLALDHLAKALDNRLPYLLLNS